MNKNRQKGYLRDKKVIQSLEKLKVLNTDQIYELHFNNIKSGKRVCQRRLEKLSTPPNKQINRNRFSVDQDYFYFIEKQPVQVRHKLLINWGYIAISKKLKAWQDAEILYEQNYEILRTDALVSIAEKIIKNSQEVKKYSEFIFIEADRGTNPFDKVPLYNKLYETERYKDYWWARYATGFPTILVVTTKPKRAENIQKKIEKENRNNLAFEILLLERGV